MKHNQVRQVVFPILAAFIWGTAFVAQDLCADSIGTFAFNATRYFIAVLALLVVIAVSDKAKKNRPTPTAEEKKAANKQLWLGGLCCGVALAIASNFQQAGLVAGTDAGKAGYQGGFLPGGRRPVDPGVCGMLCGTYSGYRPLYSLLRRREVELPAIPVCGHHLRCVYVPL